LQSERDAKWTLQFAQILLLVWMIELRIEQPKDSARIPRERDCSHTVSYDATEFRSWMVSWIEQQQARGQVVKRQAAEETYAKVDLLCSLCYHIISCVNPSESETKLIDFQLPFHSQPVIA